MAALPIGDGMFDVVRPQPLVVVRATGVAADYVVSWASFQREQVSCPWPEVAEGVRRHVQAAIDHDGTNITSGDLAAFVCR